MSTTDRAAVERMAVRQVMTPNVLGVVPTAPLEVVLRMMVEAGVRHLPVVGDGRCLGLLHESDVLWRLWSTTASTRPLAGAVARSPVLSVDVTDDVRSVARRLTVAGSDAAVVHHSGALVGIVTATDLLALLAGVDGPARPVSAPRPE